MANKITVDSVRAFVIGKPFRRENMAVELIGDSVYLKLHGNTIAYRSSNEGKIVISNCGWETNTTKMRLNYLLGIYNSPFRIRQKNFIWYLGDKVWDGGRTYIYSLNTTIN
jgi:hypothetical protein